MASKNLFILSHATGDATASAHRRRRIRMQVVAVASAIVLSLSGVTAALADDIVVDGDGATPIVASSTIAFGDVCTGQSKATSMLVAAERQGGGNAIWVNGATLTATTSVTGIAVAELTDSSILLPTNWEGAANKTYASDTAAVRLTVTPTTPGSLSGSLTVTLTGANKNGVLSRPAVLTWTANAVSCNTAPTVTVQDVTLEGNVLGGRTLAFAEIGSASDAQDPAPTVTCTPAIGSLLPLGPNTVTCTAKDSGNLTATDSGVVTVVDTTKPVISGTPGSATLEAASSSGATHTFVAPTASDVVWGAVGVTCTPASGSTFALGATTVSCMATDGSMNSNSTSFQVNVQDKTAPAFEQHADVTVEATSADGAGVTFDVPTATDAVSGAIAGTCVPASGSLFPLGDSVVGCTATDGAGNTGTTSFTVHVVDTTAPALTVPGDITQEATAANGANVDYEASATDAVDAEPEVVCTPLPGTFALGTTTVSCTATDAAGNTSDPKTFTVTVEDTTAPTIVGLPADFELEGNTAGGALGAYVAPTATDLVDPAPIVECLPDVSALFALGATTVTCTATDQFGNQSEGSFVVTVVDTTDPEIEWVSTLPAPNAQGWNSSDVTVTWECTDIVGVTAGTVSQELSEEGADLSATGTCTDTSGNTASDTQTGIDLDKSGPSANLAVYVGTPGDNGWYVSDVTIATSGSDTLSGPPTCTADQFLTSDSTGTVFDGSCTNKAGLVTDAAPLTVKRDTVAPTITDEGVISATAGTNGWYISVVTNRFTATDATSGVAGAADFQRDSGVAEGATVKIPSGAVADNAGNEAAGIDSVALKIDLSNPTDVSFVNGPTGGSSHYFGQVPAAPSCTATDAVSGLSSCTVTGYSSAVGTHTMTATARDNAGRTTSITRSYTVLGWTLNGFYQPVDMSVGNTVVYNSVKNGSTVPLKFEIFAGSTEKTTVDAVKSLTYVQTACNTTALTDEIETVATGATVLRYDSSAGQYIYNWKTPTTAGKCYRVTMTTQDDATLVAYFKLK
jgi:hypothetical protein